MRPWFPFLLVVLAGGLGARAALRASRPASELYDRSLEHHIERTQAKLEATIELWEDHTTWETAWRVRTENYEVRTTRSRAFGMQLAQSLEAMLGHYRQVLQVDFAPAEPFQVFVFPTIEAYNQYGDQWGAEHSSFLGSFYASQAPEQAVAAVYDENRTRLHMSVTHSALHQFLNHAFSQPPPVWVDEGLASYFALFWDYDYGVRELQRLRSDERLFVPVEDLLGAPIGDYTDRTQSRFIELGMLFTYLLSYGEETRTVLEEGVEIRAPFARYLRTLLAGSDTRADEMRALLTDRRTELDEALRTFDFGAD